MKNYFTIEELCKSETAERLHINNTPPEYIRKHLLKMIEFLNPLREAWGSAITVTSGFRCPELNAAVGGSPTSVHKIGWAVDLQPTNKKIETFKRFVVEYLQNGQSWDQCLLEKGNGGKTQWVHLGLYSNSGEQRKQIKDMIV